MSGRAVVEGAKMWCSAGTTPCKLNPTTDPFAKVNGVVLATIRDNQPIPNFFVTFGFCNPAFKPCHPAPVGPWQPGESGVKLLTGIPVLDEQSFLICGVGPGLITITDPGQSFFYVDTGSMNVELIYDGVDLIGYATEQKGTVRIYDTDAREVKVKYDSSAIPTDDIQNLIDIIGVAGLGRHLLRKLGGKGLLGLLGIKSAEEIAEMGARRWAANIREMLRKRLARKRAIGGLKPSPYSTRVDPRFPNRPHPKWSIDTHNFPSGARTVNGGIRNSRQFWRRWADQNPETLSPANRSRIARGRSPKVDEQWAQYFPEHAQYKGETIIHHHVNQGRYAVPVPKGTHRGSGGPHHGKKPKDW